MKNFSAELTNALESDCAHSMEPLMKGKRSEDFDDLVELLAEDVGESNMKVKALYALGRWGDTKAVTAIGKFLPSFNESERVTAVDALGRLGSAPALNSVISLKEDPSSNVRKFVVKALSRFNKPKADKELKFIQENDKEPFVRDYATKLSLKAAKNK